MQISKKRLKPTILTGINQGGYMFLLDTYHKADDIEGPSISKCLHKLSLIYIWKLVIYFFVHSLKLKVVSIYVSWPLCVIKLKINSFLRAICFFLTYNANSKHHSLVLTKVPIFCEKKPSDHSFNLMYLLQCFLICNHISSSQQLLIHTRLISIVSKPIKIVFVVVDFVVVIFVQKR